jgi:hypothetical protein
MAAPQSFGGASRGERLVRAMAQTPGVPSTDSMTAAVETTPAAADKGDGRC